MQWNYWIAKRKTQIMKKNENTKHILFFMEPKTVGQQVALVVALQAVVATRIAVLEVLVATRIAVLEMLVAVTDDATPHFP